jgi:hypothetical protein
MVLGAMVLGAMVLGTLVLGMKVLGYQREIVPLCFCTFGVHLIDTFIGVVDGGGALASFPPRHTSGSPLEALWLICFLGM